MQCFQKDPNLRVSARKLLRHAWIVGCRRTDAPVSRPPANFDDAVEEVKQWNKALNSSGTSLRTSIGSDGLSRYPPGGTPSKGRLSLAKPRLSGGAGAGAFRLAELDDDNWDDDFATAISPSALQLPHLRPQDNFGGLLSADKLKAFASVNDLRADVNNYDDDFEGEMTTIKGPNQLYIESQEQTIRPMSRRATAPKPPSPPKVVHQRSKSTLDPAAASPNLSRTKSPPKSHFGNKFELPARPGALYREQSSEDYSDLFSDDDSVFDQKVQAVRKVGSPLPYYQIVF